MFKKLATALVLASLGSTFAHAAENIGFEDKPVNVDARWTFSLNSSLVRDTSTSVSLADVYSPGDTYNSGSISPLVGSYLGVFSIAPETAGIGMLSDSSATATYLFDAATSTSDSLNVRLFTMDDRYFTSGGPNDRLTITYNGSYGVKTYNVELESVYGVGGYFLSHVTGDMLNDYVSYGPDSGWLSFGVQAGTRSIALTLTNVYDEFGGNAPLVAVDYNQGPPILSVPEPETYAMLIAGLGIVGGVARRRQRNV